MPLNNCLIFYRCFDTVLATGENTALVALFSHRKIVVCIFIVWYAVWHIQDYQIVHHVKCQICCIILISVLKHCWPSLIAQHECNCWNGFEYVHSKTQCFVCLQFLLHVVVVVLGHVENWSIKHRRFLWFCIGHSKDVWIWLHFILPIKRITIVFWQWTLSIVL